MLFYDKKGDTLYSLYPKDEFDQKKNILIEENIVRLPVNMGLTGAAVRARRTMAFQDGKDDPRYVLEVDNITQILNYKNVLISPIFDHNDELTGVIHLINKRDQELISVADKEDAAMIFPALAGVLNFCDSATEVTQVSAGLTRVMDSFRASFREQENNFERICLSWYIIS